jgi:hypothetical protein
MRSFTSSFDRIRKVRLVPDRPWPRIGLMVVAMTLALTLGWEATVRGVMGYGTSINDTPGLWAMSRDTLARHPDSVAIIGASRIRFGLDHDVVSEALGGARVVNLSMNGSVARPQLANLAADEAFTGLVICGYTPGLFWAPGGPNLQQAIDWIEAAPRRTPSARLGQALALGPESVLAFLNKEDLALGPLLRRWIRIPNREGARLPPRLPPYFARNLVNRREIMWEKMETDPAFQLEVQGIWRVLFSFGGPLPPDLLAKLRADVVADVKRIRARGGEVIFVRFPSSGWLREFENETAPREAYWEPLLAESGCLGIHFEDYPELNQYECPEWSHLTGADALQFSKDLMRIVAARRAEAK